jgi:hypothetical protein
VLEFRFTRPPRCHLFSSSPQNTAVQSPLQNCERIRKLGYTVGKHVKLYGEHIELVSDPFVEGLCVAVHAISSENPSVRTVDLPVSILVGWEDLFQERAHPIPSELIAKMPLPHLA